MIALQNHILDFTQRLHTVEVERRQLLTELGGLKTQIAGLGSAFDGPVSPGEQVLMGRVADLPGCTAVLIVNQHSLPAILTNTLSHAKH